MMFDMLRCRVKPRYPGAAKCSPEKRGCTSCIQESLLRSATHITASHPEFVALAKTTTSIPVLCYRRGKEAEAQKVGHKCKGDAVSWDQLSSGNIVAYIYMVTLCMKHVTVKLNSTWFIHVASRRQPPAPHRISSERSTLLMMSAIVLFYCHCSLLLPSLRDKNPCAAATVWTMLFSHLRDRS